MRGNKSFWTIVSQAALNYVTGQFGINQEGPLCGLHVGSATTPQWTGNNDVYISGNCHIEGQMRIDNAIRAYGNLEAYSSGGTLAAQLRASFTFGRVQMVYGVTPAFFGLNLFTVASFSHYNGIWGLSNFSSNNPNITITSFTAPSVRNNEFVRLGWRNGRPAIVAGFRTPTLGSTPVDYDQSLWVGSEDGKPYGLSPTYDGGFATYYENQTGAASERGRIVTASSATDLAVQHTATDDDKPIGVVYESGVANGSQVPIVNSGIAYVLFETSQGSTRGNWVRTSLSEAGYADGSNANPGVGKEFESLGITLATIAPDVGNHILVPVALKLN